ncbi:hypothetical protein [Paludibaculum fermentans]|uniref:hypothetical protein n=1 Tax=Paludibaculum fermentans TaxID=1473598 RepID=UPI003EB8EC4E
MRPADGRQVLDFVRTLPLAGSKCLVLSRLSAFASVEEEAKLELIAHLHASTVSVPELVYISRVDDPRINTWFAFHLYSDNKCLRGIAQRVVQRGKQLPSSLVVCDVGPDVGRAMVSTEINLVDLSKLLSEIEAKLAKRLPGVVRKAQFLSALAVGQWVYAQVNTKQGELAQLWFRLEDIDVVEVALTKGAATPVTS